MVIPLPSVLKQFEGLKSIVVDNGNAFDIKTTFDAFTLLMIRDLGPQLESLELCNVSPLSNLISVLEKGPQSKKPGRRVIFPNLTSLVLKSRFYADFSLLNIILNDVPSNLTRLNIDNDGEDINIGNLKKLPVSLVDLSLNAKNLPLMDCWPHRLSFLTSLRLLHKRRMEYDHETIFLLPASLTRLHTLGTFVPAPHIIIKPISRHDNGTRPDMNGLNGNNEDDDADDSDDDDDDDDDDNYDGYHDEDGPISMAGTVDVFPKLPAGLLDFAYGGICTPKVIETLACWSSVRHLHLSGAYTLPKLPNNLESFSIDSRTFNLSAMPSNLKSLHINAMFRMPTDFATYTPKLENLHCLELPIQSLPFLPRSLTSLHADLMVTSPEPYAGTILKEPSQIGPFLLSLPKGSLRELVDSNGWTWVPQKELGKFYYSDARVLVTENSVSPPCDGSTLSIESPMVPFTGICGSSWTSIGHAIAVDNLSLISDLLYLNPSLWREITTTHAFHLAIHHMSMNVLNWFDKMHLLPRWRQVEKNSKKSANLAVNIAFASKKPLVVPWLMERGFSTLVGEGGSSNAVSMALSFDCVPLLEYALSQLASHNMLEKGPKKDIVDMDEEDSDEVEGKQSELVSLFDMRVLALSKYAKNCWKLLMQQDDVQNMTPTRILTDFIPLQHIFSKSLADDDFTGFELLEDLLKQHEEAVHRLMANQLSNQAEKASVSKNPKMLPSTTSSNQYDRDLGAKMDEIPPMIADILAQSLSDGSLLDRSNWTTHTLLNWMIQRKFISLNAPLRDGRNLVSVIIDKIYGLYDFLGLYEIVSEDGSDQHSNNIIEPDDRGEADPSQVFLEEIAFGYFEWMVANGSDLSSIPNLSHTVLRSPVDIRSLIATWPFKKRWQKLFENESLSPSQPS